MIKEVFFAESLEDNHYERFKELVDFVDWTFIDDGDFVGIKVHWGEAGNITFLDAHYTKILIKKIKSLGGKPFVFDTNVLYKGARQNGIDNLMNAREHGFSIENLGCPAVIADGIRGRDTVDIEAHDGSMINVGSLINQADAFVILSHFKGHIVSGIGGALKNLSMGFASRAMKQRMHADVEPELRSEGDCVECGICAEHCPMDCIELSPKANFDLIRCIGCGECIAVCPEGAIKIQWGNTGAKFGVLLMKTAAAVANKIHTKTVYFNGIINITDQCDCMGKKLEPITDDIGFTASFDPVALDTASDEITHKYCQKRGDDSFRDIYKDTKYLESLEIAEKFGAGDREYIIHKV
ncbi:MAG: DUF362 domain-containing protein [Candidatus Zixiibacteriota bacterium]